MSPIGLRLVSFLEIKNIRDDMLLLLILTPHIIFDTVVQINNIPTLSMLYYFKQFIVIIYSEGNLN